LIAQPDTSPVIHQPLDIRLSIALTRLEDDQSRSGPSENQIERVIVRRTLRGVPVRDP
jgi:hypothetical protein